MPHAGLRGQFVEESGGEPIRVLCLQISVSVTPAIRLAFFGEVSGVHLRYVVSGPVLGVVAGPFSCAIIKEPLRLKSGGPRGDL
jgi:hypothetical protein